MQQQEFLDLMKRLQPSGEAVHVVEISDDEMDRLTKEQADELVTLFGFNTLIRLPERERVFFEWLRREDEPIWTDLWGSDEDPYVVSLSFLQELLPKRRGFLICDLAEHQNFVFSQNNISPEDGQPVVNASLDIIAAKRKLSLDKAFMIEVWRAPIDQWRFAYMYNVPLAEVKTMVIWLLREGLLRLTPESDEEAGGEEQSEEEY